MDPESVADRLHRRLTPGSPNEPAGESTPPPRVADHEILKQIGSGSYGGVWLARSAGGQFRAVKVVRRGRFSSERPYEREFKGTLQFEPISRSHPGVVSILHIGRAEEAGYFYYVMELADAIGADETPAGLTPPLAVSPENYRPRTLASDLKLRGRLSLTEVLTLGVQLANALGHLHRHRLVHRDVKPSNVIFVDGQAKLADIGLVTGADEAKSFVGTEGFVPPEGPGTSRADIFGLGRLLYEAATGKDRCEFPDLPDDLDGWSSSERSGLLELNEILARACAPRSSDRHASAADLAGDLNLLLSGRSIRRAYGVKRRLKRATQAIGLLAAIAALLLLGRSLVRTAPEKPAPGKVASIAVLPFVNRSPSVDDEYFSDGLADELLNLLARIEGLRVAARTSTLHFKGKDTTIAEVGKALNVDTVLEGSVRKSENRVRISVQLVKVPEGYHLWSKTYDRTLEDLLAVQDDIAESVVSELHATLLGGQADSGARSRARAEVAKAAKGRGRDPEAHRMYLMARRLNDRFAPEDTAKAIDLLKEALARDPAFASAWGELGRAYANQANHAWAPVSEAYERSRDSVERALALEPDLAEAHSTMGFIRMGYDWDWRGAQASYARAVELAPGNALVLRRAGSLALVVGRLDEAIELCGMAVEQDPLNPGSYANLCWALHSADRLAEAEQVCRQARDLAPQKANTSALLSLIILAQGRGDDALAEVMREPDEEWRNWALAIVHHAAGRRVESDKALQALPAAWAEHSAYQLAEVHAARSETSAAFGWLERAYRQRDSGLDMVKVNPLLRSLHGDPRWGPFMRKMGFDE